MALREQRTERVSHPSEPDEWFDLRLPLTAAALHSVPKTVVTESEVSQHLTAEAIVAWSYGAPVTFDTVGQLDIDTYVWLASYIKHASGIREEPEKKVSSSVSGRTTGPGKAASPVNSAT